MTTVEEELKDYFSRFPRRIVRGYHLVCDICAHNIGRLGLTIGEICEGCSYQLLTGSQGRRFVARRHVDHMHELFPHESIQNCHGAKTEMILDC